MQRTLPSPNSTGKANSTLLHLDPTASTCTWGHAAVHANLPDAPLAFACSARGALGVAGLLLGWHLCPALLPLLASPTASYLLPAPLTPSSGRCTGHIRPPWACTSRHACCIAARARPAAAPGSTVAPCCGRVAAAAAWGVEAQQTAVGALLPHQQLLAVELQDNGRAAVHMCHFYA